MNKYALLALACAFGVALPAYARRPVFDGPVSRPLSADEEKVMANSLISVVPSLLFQDQAAISNCTLLDATGRDRPYELSIECDYRSTLGGRFRVSFDNINRDDERRVIDASFSYMGR